MLFFMLFLPHLVANPGCHSCHVSCRQCRDTRALRANTTVACGPDDCIGCVLLGAKFEQLFDDGSGRCMLPQEAEPALGGCLRGHAALLALEARVVSAREAFVKAAEAAAVEGPNGDAALGLVVLAYGPLHHWNVVQRRHLMTNWRNRNPDSTGWCFESTSPTPAILLSAPEAAAVASAARLRSLCRYRDDSYCRKPVVTEMVARGLVESHRAPLPTAWTERQPATEQQPDDVLFRSWQVTERSGPDFDSLVQHRHGTGAIVYLGQRRSSSRPELDSFKLLLRSLELLHQNYNHKHRHDVLIFHEGEAEGGFTTEDQHELRSAGREYIQFHTITTGGFWELPSFLGHEEASGKASPPYVRPVSRSHNGGARTMTSHQLVQRPSLLNSSLAAAMWSAKPQSVHTTLSGPQQHAWLVVAWFLARLPAHVPLVLGTRVPLPGAAGVHACDADG